MDLHIKVSYFWPKTGKNAFDCEGYPFFCLIEKMFTMNNKF